MLICLTTKPAQTSGFFFPRYSFFPVASISYVLPYVFMFSTIAQIVLTYFCQVELQKCLNLAKTKLWVAEVGGTIQTTLSVYSIMIYGVGMYPCLLHHGRCCAHRWLKLYPAKLWKWGVLNLVYSSNHWEVWVNKNFILVLLAGREDYACIPAMETLCKNNQLRPIGS